MNEVFVNQIIQQNRAVDPEVQFRVAELFLNVDQRAIIDFIQNMEDTSTTAGVVHQLIQRLRLALHPDKNREHPAAGEAFTRM